MRMLDERMAQLAALQPAVVAPEEPVYCRHIRQVHFNAWHYVDGNLWASLAATIFEGLVDEADPAVQEQKRDQLGEATRRAIEAPRRTRDGGTEPAREAGDSRPGVHDRPVRRTRCAGSTAPGREPPPGAGREGLDERDGRAVRRGG